MRIGFRLVTGALDYVDLDDPNASIQDLKDLIAPKAKLMREGLKVCFKGRVLDEEGKKAIDEGLTEGDTVIVIGKPIVKTPTAAPTAAPPVPSPPPATVTAPAALPANEESVATIMAMGFPRLLAEQALLLSNHDVERAVNYLLTEGRAQGGGGDDDHEEDDDEEGEEEEVEEGDLQDMVSEALVTVLSGIPNFEQARLHAVSNNISADVFANALCTTTPNLRPLIDAAPEVFALIMQYGPNAVFEGEDEEEEEGEEEEDD